MLIEVRKTKEFERWISKLRDLRAETRIDARIDLLARGHAGDFKSVGGGVFEMRIHLGPGYRIYYAYNGTSLVIVLAGGDKNSQDEDIRLAQKLAQDL
jgi:putative addiction module killer protein